MVAAVGDVHFIRRVVDGHAGGPIEDRLAVGAARLIRACRSAAGTCPLREYFVTCASARCGAAGAAPRPRARSLRCGAAGAAPRAAGGGPTASGSRRAASTAPAGAGSRPDAAIQTLPSPSTAMPPVDCGQTKPRPGRPSSPSRARRNQTPSPTAPARSTRVEVGGVSIIAFSADSSESAPRCTIHT